MSKRSINKPCWDRYLLSTGRNSNTQRWDVIFLRGL